MKTTIPGSSDVDYNWIKGDTNTVCQLYIHISLEEWQDCLCVNLCVYDTYDEQQLEYTNNDQTNANCLFRTWKSE